MPEPVLTEVVVSAPLGAIAVAAVPVVPPAEAVAAPLARVLSAAAPAVLAADQGEPAADQGEPAAEPAEWVPDTVSPAVVEVVAPRAGLAGHVAARDEPAVGWGAGQAEWVAAWVLPVVRPAEFRVGLAWLARLPDGSRVVQASSQVEWASFQVVRVSWQVEQAGSQVVQA
jgi:hypothetical protein